MRTSTYYDLKLVEGTDIVNPLTTEVPNLTKIDEVMHNNAVAGVTLATELTTGTVHALIRDNSDCAVIRFVATSNWSLGDTITVDGIPVAALLPSGEVLPNGAYVINANVLCILTGTNLTVYAERKKVDNASEIAYNGTTVEAELNRVNSDLSAQYILSDEYTITQDVTANTPSQKSIQIAIPSGYKVASLMVTEKNSIYSTCCLEVRGSLVYNAVYPYATFTDLVKFKVFFIKE